MSVASKKSFPPWLKKRFCFTPRAKQTQHTIERLDLRTVCESAACPNRGECFSAGVATFLILGDICTRECSFCAVKTGRPRVVDKHEPERISRAVVELGLRHIVITSVTRDDLTDGGAGHFADVIRSLKGAHPEVAVEVLTPDFKGRRDLAALVMEAGPDIYSHNLETVERLYERVRPGADYERSLKILRRVSDLGGRKPGCWTKSGLMLGLGETRAEIGRALADLYQAGCQFLTLGQYLRPAANNIEVSEFIRPQIFKELEQEAYNLGFRYVASGPFVRSSYQAHKALEKN